jgi:hypothetical protein
LPQRLRQIIAQIPDIFDAYRHAQQPLWDPGVRLNRVAVFDQRFDPAQ